MTFVPLTVVGVAALRRSPNIDQRRAISQGSPNKASSVALSGLQICLRFSVPLLSLLREVSL
jgi:hypothetical protein